MMERVKCVICGKTIIGESDHPYSCLSCSHYANASYVEMCPDCKNYDCKSEHVTPSKIGKSKIEANMKKNYEDNIGLWKSIEPGVIDRTFEITEEESAKHKKLWDNYFSALRKIAKRLDDQSS